MWEEGQRLFFSLEKIYLLIYLYLFILVCFFWVSKITKHTHCSMREYSGYWSEIIKSTHRFVDQQKNGQIFWWSITVIVWVLYQEKKNLESNWRSHEASGGSCRDAPLLPLSCCLTNKQIHRTYSWLAASWSRGKTIMYQAGGKKIINIHVWLLQITGVQSITSALQAAKRSRV